MSPARRRGDGRGNRCGGGIDAYAHVNIGLQAGVVVLGGGIPRVKVIQVDARGVRNVVAAVARDNLVDLLQPLIMPVWTGHGVRRCDVVEDAWTVVGPEHRYGLIIRVAYTKEVQ